MDLKTCVSTAKAAVRAEGGEFQARFFPPAGPDQIAKCERSLGRKLPPSMYSLLSQSDGLLLKSMAHDDVSWTTVEVFGTGGLVYRTEKLRDELDLSASEWGALVALADYQDGNHCLLDPDAAGSRRDWPVVDGDHEGLPFSWRDAWIANDAEHWLSTMLQYVTEHPKLAVFAYWLDKAKMRSLRACNLR